MAKTKKRSGSGSGTRKKGQPAKPKRTTTKKKTTARRSSPAKSKKAASVDSVLKKFAKERTQSEAQLATLQKKQVEVKDKLQKLNEQIQKLGQQIGDTRGKISQLDSRRDAEVKELLAQLGVKIDAADDKPPTQKLSLGNPSPPAAKNSMDRGGLQPANGR